MPRPARRQPLSRTTRELSLALFRGPCAAVLVLGCALVACSIPAFGQCQRAKLVDENGQMGDKFAFSATVSGQRVLIGAPWDDDRGDNFGSVFVFERASPTGVWVEAAKLPPEGSDILAGFGWSVAIDRELAVISARGPQTAYIFEHSAEGWRQTADLVAGDHWFGDFYGEQVGISGNLVIVGAPHDDDNGWRSGSAYVFERDPNAVWSQGAKLLADDGEAYNKFGTAVAISGDVVVIGAPEDDDLGGYSGSAYVFERDPNGNWAQSAKLLPHDGGPFWCFGDSVAVSGNRALVGATAAQAFAPSGGAAYIFERDPNGDWPEVAQLVSDDINNSDFFGIAVALDGDIALIGAVNADYNATDSGAAYVFVRQADGSWPQVAKIGASDGAFDDRFGSSLALSGNTAVMGAYQDDDQGSNSGSAYVFAVGPDEDGDGIMDACLCPGDLDGDLDVDLADLAQLLSHYGMTSGATYEDGDLDADGDVDLSDLGALLAEYGTVCP